MTAIAEEAQTDELSLADTYAVTAITQLATASMSERKGYEALAAAELARKRAAALDIADQAYLDAEAAEAAVSPVRDRLARAQRTLDIAQGLAVEIGGKTSSASLRVRVKAKTEAAVIAGEVAQAAAARDGERNALAAAENAVRRARQRETDASAAADVIDQALSDPLGSELGKDTEAWKMWMTWSGEWLNHLDPKPATRESRFASALLMLLLKRSG